MSAQPSAQSSSIFGASSFGRALRALTITTAGIGVTAPAQGQIGLTGKREPANQPDPVSPESAARLQKLDQNFTPIVPSSKFGDYRFEERREGKTPIVYRTVGVFSTNIPGLNVVEPIWAVEVDSNEGKSSIFLNWRAVDGGSVEMHINSWIDVPEDHQREPFRAVVKNSPRLRAPSNGAGEQEAEPEIGGWTIITAFLELRDRPAGEAIAIVGGNPLNNQPMATFDFKLTQDQAQRLDESIKQARLILRYHVLTRAESGQESRALKVTSQEFVQRVYDRIAGENKELKVNGAPVTGVSMEQLNRICREITLNTETRIDIASPVSAEFMARGLQSPSFIQSVTRDQQTYDFQSMAPEAASNIIERMKPLITDIVRDEEAINSQTNTDQKSRTVTWSAGAEGGKGLLGFAFSLGGGVTVSNQTLKRIEEFTGSKWRYEEATQRYVPSSVTFFTVSAADLAVRSTEYVVSRQVASDMNWKIADISPEWTVDKLKRITDDFAKGKTYEYRFNEQLKINENQGQLIEALREELKTLRDEIAKSDKQLAEQSSKKYEVLLARYEQLRASLRHYAQVEFDSLPVPQGIAMEDQRHYWGIQINWGIQIKEARKFKQKSVIEAYEKAREKFFKDKFGGEI